MNSNATHNSTARSAFSPAPRVRLIQRHPRRQGQVPSPSLHVTSAGGVIYRRKHGRLEIFFIKDPFGRWTFPKGKREMGETLLQTAKREIKEETGLDKLRYVAPLGKTSFQFRRDILTVEKTVFFFLFEAKPFLQAKLTGDGAIWEGRWFPANKALQASAYRNLDRLLVRALRLIAQEERRKLLRPSF